MTGRLTIVCETPATLRPYRILEIYDSVDGPRTRVCEGTWRTYVEAWDHMMLLALVQITTPQKIVAVGFGDPLWGAIYRD